MDQFAIEMCVCVVSIYIYGTVTIVVQYSHPIDSPNWVVDHESLPFANYSLHVVACVYSQLKIYTDFNPLTHSKIQAAAIKGYISYCKVKITTM